jgi:hypothetical protein
VNPKGCDRSSSPQIVDIGAGSIFVLSVVAVAGGEIAGGRSLREAADPVSILLLPAALFFVSALQGRAQLARCRSLTLQSRAEQALAAARAGDCSTARAIGLEVSGLDANFYKNVFVRDATLSRCIPPDPRFFCTTSPVLTDLCLCSDVQSTCEERQRSLSAVGATMSTCTGSSTDTCTRAESAGSPGSNAPSSTPLVDAGVIANPPGVMP